MSQRVVIREFNSRGEAAIVCELLRASGIEAFVVSDDCGAVDPALSFARGVQLLVAEDDVRLAEQIIAEAKIKIPNSEGEVIGPDEDPS